MFKCEFTSAALFKSVILTMKENICEMTCSCDQDKGIIMFGMSPTHVSLAQVHIPPTCMARYVCEQPVKFGVNLLHLAALLRMVDDDAELVLMAELPDPKSMHVHIASGDRLSDYEVPLFESDSEEQAVVGTEVASIRMQSKEFRKLIADGNRSECTKYQFEIGEVWRTDRDAEWVNGVRPLKLVPTLNVCMNSQDGLAFKVCIPRSDIVCTGEDKLPNKDVSYSLGESLKMTLGANVSPVVILRFIQEGYMAPLLCIDFPLTNQVGTAHSSDAEDSHIRFYLAPISEQKDGQ